MEPIALLRPSTTRLLKILTPLAVITILDGCGGNPVCSCPAIAVSKAYYVGSFVSGQQSPPVQFTAIGQTATVTLQAFKNNQPVPLAAVAGTAVGPCSAATLQPLAAPGEIRITAVAHGTCNFVISSAGASQNVSVNVP